MSFWESQKKRQKKEKLVSVEIMARNLQNLMKKNYSTHQKKKKTQQTLCRINSKKSTYGLLNNKEETTMTAAREKLLIANFSALMESRRQLAEIFKMLKET